VTKLTPLDKKLDFFIKNSVNVLLKGRHGVGKTQMTLQAFKRAKKCLGIFSASTLDAYVDLRGIPEIVTNDKNKQELRFVQTQQLQTYDALFLDELNRATSATMNALFELVQFQSINGVKLPRLKMVWAAVNPDDDDYTVSEMDPALLDRFQIPLTLPNKVSKTYFINKYGTNIADIVSDWSNKLSNTDTKKLSPRRIDEAVDWALKGEDIEDFINPRTIPSVEMLKTALTADLLVANLRTAVIGHNRDKACKIMAKPGVTFLLEEHFDDLMPFIKPNDWEKNRNVWDVTTKKEVNAMSDSELLASQTCLLPVQSQNNLWEKIREVNYERVQNSLRDSIDKETFSTDGDPWNIGGTVANTVTSQNPLRHDIPIAVSSDVWDSLTANGEPFMTGVRLTKIEQILLDDPNISADEIKKRLDSTYASNVDTLAPKLTAPPTTYGLKYFSLSMCASQVGLDVNRIHKSYGPNSTSLRKLIHSTNNFCNQPKKAQDSFINHYWKDCPRVRNTQAISADDNTILEQACVSLLLYIAWCGVIDLNNIQCLNRLVYLMANNSLSPVPLKILWANMPVNVQAHPEFVLYIKN